MSATIVYNPFTQNFDFVGTSGGGTGDVNGVISNDSIMVGPNGSGYINVVGTGNISTSGNAGTFTLTITEKQAQVVTNYTNVNHAMSPYTVLSTDFYISVDASAGAVTLLFPDSPTQYQTYVVKDRTGNALVNNITLTTVGGVVTIDGVTNYIYDEEFEASDIMFNGTSYEVY